MATMEDIRRKARRVRQRHQASNLIEGDQIAVENDDGVTSVKVTDPDTQNLIWVKLYGSDERIVQAYNARVQVRDKLPVWLRRLPDGTYEVEGLRSRDGTDYLGEAAGTMNTPETIGDLLGTVWPARNLKPGRAHLSPLGAMYLEIDAFYFSGGYFAGGSINLSSAVPATSGKQVWAVVYYDPGSEALGVTTGTEYGLPYIMTEMDLGDIALSPQFIPLAGVLLKNGDMALNANSIIIARQNWIDAPVTNEAFFPIVVTDARTIPANRQLVISQVTIDTDGSITIDGLLHITG